MTSINQITVIPWLSAAIFLPSTNGVFVDPALGLMPKITLVIDYICHISGWNMISSSEKRWNMGNSVRSNNATTEFPASSSWSDVNVAKPNHQIRPIRSRFQYPHINSIFFLDLLPKGSDESHTDRRVLNCEEDTSPNKHLVRTHIHIRW